MVSAAPDSTCNQQHSCCTAEQRLVSRQNGYVLQQKLNGVGPRSLVKHGWVFGCDWGVAHEGSSRCLSHHPLPGDNFRRPPLINVPQNR